MGKKFVKKSAKSTKKSTSVKVNNKQQNKLKRGGSKKNQLTKKAARLAKKNKNLDNKNGQVEEVGLFSGSSFRRAMVNDDQIDMELRSLDYKKKNSTPQNGANMRNKRKLSNRSDGGSDDDDIEGNYKMKSYLVEGIKNSRTKQYSLPIKTAQGFLMPNNKPEIAEEPEPAPKPKKAAVSKPVVEEEAPEEPKSLIEQIREKKIFFDKIKEKIAILSRDVLQNPQEEMKKLKELRTLLTLSEVKNSNILKKLIIVSLGEIFKDIVPGYRIRPWSEKENKQSVSKEVQKLKEFEETLLKQYKLYLDYLNESLKTIYKQLFKPSDKPVTSSERASIKAYGIVCVRCLCQLVERLSHFNYASEIIQTIVEQLSSRVEEISSLAISSIEKIFKEDKDLKLSLEITQKITRLIKQKSFGVKPAILDLFLSLKLKEIQIVEDKKKKMTHKEKMKLSRADRKKLKEKEQLEIELEGKSLSDQLKTKSNHQTRILEQVFMIYFNILKKNPNFKLMPSVLEGLAKFAHLINLDFFDDLVKLMHELIESDQLTFRSKLHCIKTIFAVLSGQGEALTIDPMKFYTALYKIILRFDTLGNVENTTLLVECLDMMFIKRKKQIPTARLLAFVKRLTNITVNLEPISVTLILNFLRKLINVLNKQSDLLFDNEYQYSGIYNPELPEPDYANAQNTALWELHILRRHYCPMVSFEASDFLKQVNLEETRRTSQEIVDEMKADDLAFLESEPARPKTKSK